MIGVVSILNKVAFYTRVVNVFLIHRIAIAAISLFSIWLGQSGGDAAVVHSAGVYTYFAAFLTFGININVKRNPAVLRKHALPFSIAGLAVFLVMTALVTLDHANAVSKISAMVFCAASHHALSLIAYDLNTLSENRVCWAVIDSVALLVSTFLTFSPDSNLLSWAPLLFFLRLFGLANQAKFVLASDEPIPKKEFLYGLLATWCGALPISFTTSFFSPVSASAEASSASIVFYFLKVSSLVSLLLTAYISSLRSKYSANLDVLQKADELAKIYLISLLIASVCSVILAGMLIISGRQEYLLTLVPFMTLLGVWPKQWLQFAYGSSYILAFNLLFSLALVALSVLSDSIVVAVGVYFLSYGVLLNLVYLRSRIRAS